MTAQASLPNATDLTTGPLLVNPLGYGEARPQFSWKLPADGTVEHQSAYHLVCASDPGLLPETPDLWDSGWVESAESTFVDYGGGPLGSRQRVYWTVRYKSGSGAVSGWAGPAMLETALLDPADWQARWILLPEEFPEETPPSPFLRRPFQLEDKAVKSARLYASARGVFELHLNGERVGNDYFTPDWTDYGKRSLYRTFDITGLLQPGDNVIGAILGETWYTGILGWGTNRNQYGLVPQLLLQLEVTYADGSRQVVVSDDSWKGTRGPIRYANIYLGERYDARQELGAWSKPGYDAPGWESVESKAHDPEIRLTPQASQPVRKIMELQPVSIEEPSPGKFVFDFGQNLVGWVRIRVPGEAGRTYILEFAEMLLEDGNLYTENYRSAVSVDTYTCRGEEVEEWEPRFTFHGFRYAQISGLPEGTRPSADWVTAVVLHNDMPPTGLFSSSDETLNRLQKNIEWGQRGNFLAVPTDCPQRDERLGWTGDAQVFCATANFNFNTLAFFVKWAADLRDSQFASGGIPFYVPTFPRGRERSSSAWGDAAVIVPWEVYQSFGYKPILGDNYAMMNEWLRYYEEHEQTTDLIHRGFTFGDWLQPYTSTEDGRFGETDTGLIGTAYFARCVDLVARVAEILDKPEDAARRREQFAAIRQAFQTAFFDESGRLTTEFETQSGYLLALHFGLLEEALVPQAVAHLVRLIEEEAGGHLRTGFLGTPIINPVLSRHGHTDLAYSLLFRETYPGWFYSIAQGATTMWERWNSYSREEGFGDAGMNSFNHYAYGSIGEWMYGTVAGLQASEPGYRSIRFRPVPGGPLDHAEALLDTPYGIARSHWQKDGEALELNLTVPPNTTGELVLPGLSKALGPGTHRLRLSAQGELTRVE